MQGINTNNDAPRRPVLEVISDAAKSGVDMVRALGGKRAAMISLLAMIACTGTDKDDTADMADEICDASSGYDNASAVVGSSCVRTYCEKTEQGTTDLFRLGAEDLVVNVSGDGSIEVAGLQLEDMGAAPLSTEDVECLVSHDLVAVGAPNDQPLCDQSLGNVYTVLVSTLGDAETSVNKLTLTASPVESADDTHTWYMFTEACSEQVEWPYGGTEQPIDVGVETAR